MSKKYLYVNLTLDDQLAIPEYINDARLFSTKEKAANALLTDLSDRLNDIDDSEFEARMRDRNYKNSYKIVQKEISGKKSSAEVYELIKGEIQKLYPVELYRIYEKTIE